MKIIRKEDAVHVEKPEGTTVDYYLRDEYEIHYNEQSPKTTQTWHRHEKILETIFFLEGELTAHWKENGENMKEVIRSGDLVETGRTLHTFENHTGETVKFLVIKQVPSGKNNRELFKKDKVVEEMVKK